MASVSDVGGYDPGFSVRVPDDPASMAGIDEMLRDAYARGQQSAPRASILAAAPVIGLLSWIAAVAFVCLLAWPAGLSAHAVWWLFDAGWNVIG